MIKPAFKTLSLSFAALAAAAMSAASEQNTLRRLSATSAEPVRFECATQVEIERGWEHQQQLLEARLAAKASESVKVPGAIISPLFPSFAPYRTDVPSVTSARKGSKASRPSTGRGASANKS